MPEPELLKILERKNNMVNLYILLNTKERRKVRNDPQIKKLLKRVNG